MLGIFFAIILVVACVTVAAADSYEDALAAFMLKDYTLAARLFRPLADQGDAGAQLNLGLMYHNGQGVPQDDQEAAKWYRKSAEQGEVSAQGMLSVCYQFGSGVPQDFVRAHMWFNVAAAASSGNDKKAAMENRDEIASRRMTVAQIERAQEMARHCQETKFKECD